MDINRSVPVKLGEELDSVMDSIAGIIFPRRCPVCDGIIKNSEVRRGRLICGECESKVPIIYEPRCKKCSKPLSDSRAEYCYDCSRVRHKYKTGLALVEHRGPMRKSVYSIKYKNRREYLDYYMSEMARIHGDTIREWNADALVPVPMYRKKEIKRGFNQAAEAAKILGTYLDMPVEERLIVRTADTRPQKELSDTERRKNVEKAFHIDKNIVKLRKVILVDDIYTTGSTIDSCAKVLIDKGVEEVCYISISIGDGL